MDGINYLSPTSPQRAHEVGMIGAIAQWCECLQGCAPLRPAMEMLADSVGVEAVALTRAARDHTGDLSSLFFDDAPQTIRDAALDRSFAPSVLGPYFRQPKPGSVWFKTLTEIEPDPKLERFHRRRHLTVGHHATARNPPSTV